MNVEPTKAARRSRAAARRFPRRIETPRASASEFLAGQVATTKQRERWRSSLPEIPFVDADDERWRDLAKPHA